MTPEPPLSPPPLPPAAAGDRGTAAPATTTTTATAATLARLRRRLPRTLAFVAVLCAVIAGILTALERRALGPHLVYSFAVGFACWLCVDGVRLLLAWATDRTRRLRGVPASSAGFDTGWRGIAPAVLVAVLAGPQIGMRIGDALTGNTSASLLDMDTPSTRLTLVFALVGSVISVLVLSLMERLSNAHAQAEAAKAQAAENQLRLLQSQLQPHMLFNTLANVRVLIGLDPPRAQAMLDRMIAFLRATLNASRVSLHPLAAEFDRTADYLALMAVRMGDRLQVQIEPLPAALAALAVPPLLLQPLVENAIQHGLEPKVGGGRLQVRAVLDGATLVLTVRDTGVGLPDANVSGSAASAALAGGFGVLQVRERLHTLYGKAASLALGPATDAEGGTLATVRMPVGPEKPTATAR